ncbi:MAG: hypothetical protein NTW52_08855 [Planctomycetota bacterium]|nr:hypothetical protein [Planctomycetota bacterium]
MHIYLLRHPPHLCSSDPLEVSLAEPMALATVDRATKSVPISPEASAYGSEYIHTTVKLGSTTPEPMALATGFFLPARPSTKNNPHPTSPATAFRASTVTNKTARDRHSNPLRSTARATSFPTWSQSRIPHVFQGIRSVCGLTQPSSNTHHKTVVTRIFIAILRTFKKSNIEQSVQNEP